MEPKKLRETCGGSRATAWLLTLNIGVSILLWIADGMAMLCGSAMRLEPYLGLPSDFIRFAMQPWGLLTYMFAQFAPLHLLFNMLWLWMFGRMLYDVTSDRRIWLTYLLSGLGGGIIYLILSSIAGYSGGTLLGSSASVLGMMTATAVYSPYRSVNLFLLGEVKMKWLATGCIVFTLLASWGTPLPAQGAHIGGVLSSAIFIVGVKRGWWRVQRTPKKRKVNVRNTVRAMKEVRTDHERLDELLDKIRISGYDSLTAKERDELNRISARLNK